MNKLSILAKSVLMAMSVVGMVGIVYAQGDETSPSLLSNRWTGFYGGLDAGVSFNSVEIKSQQLGFTSPGDHCDLSSDFSSFAPGIQFGYMHSFPSLITLGVEADVTFNTNQKETMSCTSSINPNVYDCFAFRNRLQTSIKGRVGFALNWNEKFLLPYVTAGASFAYAGLTYKNEANDEYPHNAMDPGWLIGAGIEWSFKQKWSVRTEYHYLGYGNIINLEIPSVYGLVDPDGNARVDQSSHNIAIAINYWI